ncbi:MULTISPECIES: hypothetical protein [unclassified Caballeronia]|uniref:hypothetical protein n=1 Tax=unclassified Caballeronia TaxID=2646786 RepID=UPI0028638C82|nr:MULTISPECIES: hypothetical protein [unclassified Caballeronia]MDR5755204.1 hypothetical protein [Caballeronia sp. LZ024]MDR5845386.1 hypothetical protein [Caballeronia sp. LZ031]
MAFTIDASSIVFKQTRRGINATAVILTDGGKRVGEIHDVAEKIVADVKFVEADARDAFAAEARRLHPVVLGRADHGDDIFISEYARVLLADAEKSCCRSYPATRASSRCIAPFSAQQRPRPIMLPLTGASAAL